MGGERSNVKLMEGYKDSCVWEDGSAYSGRIVGMAPSVRYPGYSSSVSHQGVNSALKGHHCGTHLLTAR